MRIIPFPATKNTTVTKASLSSGERRAIHWLAGIVILSVIGLLGWFFGVWQTAPPLVSSAAQEPNGEAQLATVKQYCVTCHNDREDGWRQL